MGTRITITESERKHISKLHKLNESNNYTFEQKVKIIEMLNDLVDNWDKYPMEYCQTTNKDDMNIISSRICEIRKEGKGLDSIHKTTSAIVGGDSELETYTAKFRDKLNKSMDGFIDYMDSFGGY